MKTDPSWSLFGRFPKTVPQKTFSDLVNNSRKWKKSAKKGVKKGLVNKRALIKGGKHKKKHRRSKISTTPPKSTKKELNIKISGET